MSASPAAVRNFGVGIGLGVVATTVVGLRFLAKRLVAVQEAFADDYWILGSLILVYGFLASAGVLVYNGGIGQHNADLTPEESIIYYRAGFAVQILYMFTITAAKLSVILLYGRLFPTRRFLFAARIVGGLCISWFLASFFVTVFQCKDIAGAWDNSRRLHCLPVQIFVPIIGLTGLATDIMTLCLPLPVVWRLEGLRVRQKITLTCIFLMGSFVCIASLLRIVTLRNVTSDLPYTTLTGASWSLYEAELAVICACLPTLRPLISRSDWIHRARNRLSRTSKACSTIRRISGETSPRSRDGMIISLPIADEREYEDVDVGLQRPMELQHSPKGQVFRSGSMERDRGRGRGRGFYTAVGGWTAEDMDEGRVPDHLRIYLDHETV
ncbi:MAG: hypothetical protein MMC33_007972 [Icmadophila ericetorum]|nr:hypothetical protein [Icmadophila ericetorum]